MKTYKLLKNQKGRNGWLYTVVDESGNIVATRSSKRDYVACTIDGEMFFGRLDLIGKGDHGRMLATLQDYKYNSTPAEYNAVVAAETKATRMAEMQHLATYLRYVSAKEQAGPISEAQYNLLVEFHGKDIADSCKTQRDYQIATCNVERAIARLLERIGTFAEWKARRDAWVEKYEPALQVAYLAE